MTKTTELSHQEVRHDVLEVLESEDFAAVDRFIARKSEPTHWKLRLTQSEDVEQWIRDPHQISRIQENLLHFGEAISSGPRPISILDAGCYAGYVYDYIQQHILTDRSEFTYHGIDIRAGAIDAAKEIHADCRNATFSTADLFRLRDSLGEAQYDLVLCARVLVHLPHFETAVRNLISVCSDSVYVLVPLSERARCEIRKKTDLDSGAEMIYVYRSYSPGMISKVAARNNVQFQILPARDAYASVIFHKRSRARSRTLLSRLSTLWSRHRRTTHQSVR